MGQYYAPVVIDQRENPTVMWWFLAHIYGNGLKLMEHSYVGNELVRAVETFLRMDGGMRLVWAGDYADPESCGENLYQLTGSGEEDGYGRCVAIRAGLEPLYPGYEPTLTEITEKCKVLDIPLAEDEDCRYVINLDTGCYVDTALAPRPYEDFDAKLHPLPILTCEGNGRGGGDYHGETSVVGSWARRRVTVSGRVPQGYSEVDFAAALGIAELSRVG